MNKIAIVTASGFGDGLIMLIAAHNLRKRGYDVTVFNSHLLSLGGWLENGDYLPFWENIRTFDPFDAILLQHDNTPRAQEIASLRKSGKAVYIFYTNYRYSKHGPLVAGVDFVFDPCQTMVENTCRGTHALFGPPVTMFNGIKPPRELARISHTQLRQIDVLPIEIGSQTNKDSVLTARTCSSEKQDCLAECSSCPRECEKCGLVHRKFFRRVLIHATSGAIEKNWRPDRFLQLAHQLKNAGFLPHFIFSQNEHPFSLKIEYSQFSTLESMASFLYESGFFIGNDSGPGHLASYLSIPHLIIAKSEQNMRLWRPGWLRGLIITPPRWIPNFKGLRLKEEKWNNFITVKMVLKRFNSILK